MLRCRYQSRFSLLGTFLVTMISYPSYGQNTSSPSTFVGGGWSNPTTVGSVDSKLLPEASGIAASQLVSGRLYHINDAGNSPAFVVTDSAGADARTVALDGVDTIDTEEIAVGACPHQTKESCVYIADIGDNDFARSDIQLYIVKERSQYGSRVTPDFVVSLSYPDGRAHNAESLAIHPDGWIYLLTKEIPAQLHRIAIDRIDDQGASLTLDFLGTLDLREWLDGTDKPSKIIPTAMAIHPSGDQIVILTRAAGVSFNIDLAKDLPNRSRINLNEEIESIGIQGIQLPKTKLPQTEAVTYIDNGSAIVISTEVKDGLRKKKPRPSSGGVPLVRIESLP